MASALDQLASLAAGVVNATSAARAGDWSGAGSAIGKQFVGRIEIRSQVSPPVTFDPFGPTEPSAPPNPILSLVKPQFIVYDPSGQVAMAAAPYGEPTANYLPWLLGGAVIFVVGALTIAGAVGAAISGRRARR